MTNQALFEIAKEARNYARSGYCHYKVGTALLCKNGKVYKGCNIEARDIPSNSSCAERSAFISAISNGETEFEKIMVIGGPEDGDLIMTTPCGVCRQYILEMNPEMLVVISDGNAYQEYIAKELLPSTYYLKN